MDLDLQSAPRIGVDLHILDGKFQGSRTHCIEIFSRVPALLPEMKFLFFGDILGWAPGLAERFSSANTELVQMPCSSSIQRLGLQLPLITFRHRLDLLHTQYVCPLISRCATAVTIHDILFETHPQFFTPFFNFRSRVLFRRAARQSKRVFTVSAFSRDELVRCYGISPEKIILIKNAADTNKFHAGDAGAESLPACNWCETGTFSVSDAWNRAKTTLVSSVPTLSCRPTRPSRQEGDTHGIPDRSYSFSLIDGVFVAGGDALLPSKGGAG